jgi:uncharacterized membrane protein YhaH (DUF805 family)
MNFGQAISSLYSNYANFKGRARRSAYWYAYLFYVVIYVATLMIGTTVDPNTGMPTFGPLYYIWVFANFLPMLAAGTRRLHDVGKSGWYMLIPIYGIILMATDTVPGSNAYGEPAK